MSISELYRAVTPLSPVSPPANNPGTSSTEKENAFANVLNRELKENVNLSQHAETRLKSRSIAWTPELKARIGGGIDAAQAKGSREALILADNVAVIANVKSRTVITAMDRAQMKGQIFTNIDSAVLV